MIRAKEGDSSAFETLVHRYRDKLVGYLFHRVLNHAVAEDLAQDTFFRAYCARERYEATATFGTWIYCIAHRLAINWVRNEPAGRTLPFERNGFERNGSPMRPRQLVDPSPSCDVALMREARANVVRRALSRLPKRQRAVVLMHKYQDMEYTEIARRLDCSIPCVKSLLFRAHSALRDELMYSEVSLMRRPVSRVQER